MSKYKYKKFLIGHCRRKKKYNSYSGAEYALQGIPNKDPRLEVYKCSICDNWHIGTNYKE